jgi:hypothetical protein
VVGRLEGKDALLLTTDGSGTSPRLTNHFRGFGLCRKDETEQNGLDE